ncbi:PREDICTED: uncharacterized protein LOC107105148, partial [Cyprinodon variegatus]|uniref:uncharacterized protein LOC107105148 n=1 Tax=Cyprinodon variegatus TaxID=28743 RepID=UPI000742556A
IFEWGGRVVSAEGPGGGPQEPQSWFWSSLFLASVALSQPAGSLGNRPSVIPQVIRQGRGEIVPWRQPSEEVDARNYLPCPLCLGFFLRADLWKHQVTCRKKLSIDSAEDGADPSVPASGQSADPACGDSSGEAPDPSSEQDDTAAMVTDPEPDQNQNTAQNQPKKRARVQAAASRLLPISGGASESCSEILHRMNQDSVSHEVKSDWLICRYGNKLMGSQDGSQRSYEYVSQKLRELGRLLLAAKSLDSQVRSLQDLLVPGRLSLALSAAKKAAGYRWSRPPLAVKTTLKTVCEVAISESLQDGDWEAAARTTDFYHLLGREWDNLGLQNPRPEPDGAKGGTKAKKRVDSLRTCKDLRPDVLSRLGTRPEVPVILPESRPLNLLPAPGSPRKVRRRPWSPAEKEAIWRQLGVHVLLQTVPGKEVCQRCLDQEPVLKGRHWKDIKNQVHNQIQSQKKQQFHAQMDQEENQNQKKQQPQLDQQNKQPAQNQSDQNSQYQNQEAAQNQKKQLEQQNQVYPPKKQLFHPRLDHQNPCEVHKKQLYQMDHQNQPLQAQNPSVMPLSPYGPDGPLRAHGTSLLEREPVVGPYPVLHQAPGPHMEPLLTRTDWTAEALVQNYQLNRPMDRNLLQEVGPGGPDPHSGHVRF